MRDDVGLLISAFMLTANLREAEIAKSVRKRETSLWGRRRGRKKVASELFLWGLMRKGLLGWNVTEFLRESYLQIPSKNLSQFILNLGISSEKFLCHGSLNQNSLETLSRRWLRQFSSREDFIWNFYWRTDPNLERLITWHFPCSILVYSAKLIRLYFLSNSPKCMSALMSLLPLFISSPFSLSSPPNFYDSFSLWTH